MSKKRTTKKAAKPVYKRLQCVVPDCDHVRQSRGLCPRCYITATRLIAVGKESWESLEAKGLALAPGVGRKYSSPLHKAIKQASAK